MGIDTFPVVQDEDFWAFSQLIEWKTLTEAFEHLDPIARDLKVKPLSKFVSYIRDDAAGAYDDEEFAELEAESELFDGVYYYRGGVLWALERAWFAPEAGLQSARALLDYVTEHPAFWTDEDLKRHNQRSYLQVLRTIVGILEQASERQTLFYLHMIV